MARTKVSKTLQQVVDELDKNVFQGKVNVLEMPAAGTPVNILRSQIGLLIQEVKDVKRRAAEDKKEFNETVNDFMRLVSMIETRMANMQQEFTTINATFVDLFSPSAETEVKAEELNHDN